MKKILFILTAFLAFILTGCQEDDLGRDNSGEIQNGFKLSYRVNEPVSVLTKSSVAAEKEEIQLNSFYVLFFENTTDGSGTFVEAIDLHESFGLLSHSGTLDVTFPNGSKLDKTQAYKMLFCANIETYSRFSISGVEDIHTLCQWLDEKTVHSLLLEISGVEPSDGEEQDNQNRMLNSNLPMSATAVKEASATTISVELARMVSRFDIFCEVAGYELVSVSIWNAAVTAPVWIDYSSDPVQSYTQRYYGVSASNNQVVASLYAFENLVEDPQQDDRETTCVVVGLKNSQGVIEYFRVNIKPATSEGQWVKRNHAYRTIIRGVMGTGNATEREAYVSSTSLLDIDINGWFLDESGHVQINGGNVLAVPTQHIQLFSHGDERTYYIYTLGVEDNPQVTTHIPGNLQVDFVSTSEVNVLRKHALSVKARPGSADDMEPYYVTVSYADMSVDILITQEESLGSYVNLSYTDRLYFLASELGSSDEITVTSSGRWKCKIYNGNYFSFEAGGSPVQEISGVSEGSFKIHTTQSNEDLHSRYSFVLVSLEDMPNVSEVMVLEQYGTSGQHLWVDPTHFPKIPAGGGSTDKITVFATGSWTARIEVINGSAYFEQDMEEEEDEEGDDKEGNEDEEDPTGPQVWKGANGDTFIVTFNGQKELNSYATATVTVTLDSDPAIKEIFAIEQAPFTEKVLLSRLRTKEKEGHCLI